ncbi:MAG: BamA/TamA family outer membrane protein [Proteobacteria bacterium]|nr:BamA/TamA family outer membrane protein [Pseudomonadota bacterium]
MRRAAVLGALLLCAASSRPARADTPWIDQQPRMVADERPRPIVGFRATGDTKLTDRTLGELSHYELGDRVTILDIPELEEALRSSELFESSSVALELSRDGEGVVVVATLDDKQSWIAIPALFVFTGSKAFGLGFAENNLAGENKKMLIYAQVGSSTTMFFATLLTPRVRGTRFSTRFDLYPLRRTLREYKNPADDPASTEVARISSVTFLNAGALLGYHWAWWFNTDARVRGASTTYENARGPDDTPMPVPEKDGWDVSLQLRATLDARTFDRGVSEGTYLQLNLESSIPGFDSYGYQDYLLRAYHSFRYHQHQLELRFLANAGYHLPLHDELSAGGTTDLRGYNFDQFRGDRRYVGRAEYSFAIARYRWLSLRGLGFYDATSIGFASPRASRAYLPTAGEGTRFFRTDAGGGIRIYVNNIVLPLLGFDIGYGFENKSTAFYLQVGLTDF